MGFNFKKAAESINAQTEKKVLQLMTLAPSGAGKSFLAGTMGVKTLYIHGAGESHGYDSASITGKENIIPFRWDLDDEGQPIASADDQWNRLKSVLADKESLISEGIEFVVVDSATEVEALIGATAFKRNLMTQNGKINSFKDSESTAIMFSTLHNSLASLALSGIGYNMTCILDVQEMDDYGLILESSPKLMGYRVAESLIQRFPDIVVVGQLMNPETENVAHRVYFNAGITKASKDASGTIRKTLNFNPRITGLTREQLPEGSLPADLSVLLKLKSGDL